MLKLFAILRMFLVISVFYRSINAKTRNLLILQRAPRSMVRATRKKSIKILCCYPFYNNKQMYLLITLLLSSNYFLD